MSKSLVERIRNNDQQAMSELYQRYVGRLSSVCYRYVPADSDAKDVLQNSFVKIFKAMHNFEYRDEPSFEGYLVKVVVNESLRFLQNRKRLLFVDLDEAASIQENDEEPEPESVSADELHQMISELPDGYRTVLNLYVFEGYPHKKIAEFLGIKETTSSSQLFKAKWKLARKIKDLMNKRK